MRKNSWKSRLRAILQSICLGILTLLLVIWLSPVLAQNPANSLSNLIEQGKILYASGQFSQAAQVWQQANQGYQAAGETLNQGLSLNYLALAYQALGEREKATQAITKSRELLQRSPERSPQQLAILARVLNTQGSLELAQGKPEAALSTWQEAEATYRQIGDETGILGSQISQAQALRNLGLYRRSWQILTQIQPNLENQPDSPLKVEGLHSLGIALQSVGNWEQSREVLEKSLSISQKIANSAQNQAILASLGNTARALGDRSAAQKYYQQAAATAREPLTAVQAQLNEMSLLLETQQWQEAQTLAPEIQARLKGLVPSRSALYAQVNFAESWMKLAKGEKGSLIPRDGAEIAHLLENALQEARKLPDQRAESYVLGTLGKLYEQQQQWQKAQQLTEEALQLAQEIQASEISYLWQWQLSRLLKVQGNLSGAIAANTEAVKTLQSLRQDLVTISSGLQFSFKEQVEPIYRDLVVLLLTPSSAGEQISQANLRQARQVIESLQLAQLENFFGEACLEAQVKQIDEIDRSAAAIYPIILPDRLAVILSLPNQPFVYYETRLPQQKIEQTLEEFLESLNPAFSDEIRLRLSQQVYDWLIRPAEANLAQQQIQTLVFVLDGVLRNLPMAALHNGQQYLVEQYRIALTPGLQLLDPQPLVPAKLQAFVAGISEANQGFSALPGVTLEAKEIGQLLTSQQLLNQQFTRLRFQEQVGQAPYSIVHLATHGQFSSKPEETFILAWQDTVKVKDFQDLLRAKAENRLNPIELLVLSACQTATGDDQAALGLAGMAVRSGARSTLATLWAVKDESTAVFMTEFYRELTHSGTKISKAEALRQAQLKLLKMPQFAHPFYWAPFVLVGNWL